MSSALTRAEMEAALLLMGFKPDVPQRIPRMALTHPRCAGWIKLYPGAMEGDMVMSNGVQDKLNIPYDAGESSWIAYDEFIQRWAKYLEVLDEKKTEP